MDDAGITTAVKAKMAEDKTVSATAISVETLNGTVQLSGFAKSQAERTRLKTLHATPSMCVKCATALWCALMS